MKKILIIATLLLVSCQKDYEKKILKVDITCDKTCSFEWDDKQGGPCLAAGSQSIYYKEGTQLKVKVTVCNFGNQAHVVVKVKDKTLYDNTSNMQTINVTVRK